MKREKENLTHIHFHCFFQDAKGERLYKTSNCFVAHQRDSHAKCHDLKTNYYIVSILCTPKDVILRLSEKRHLEIRLMMNCMKMKLLVM